MNRERYELALYIHTEICFNSFIICQESGHCFRAADAVKAELSVLIKEVEYLQNLVKEVEEFCSDFCTEGCCEVCKGQNEAYQQVLDIIRESKKA